ncbi:MAG: hypothetical protein H6619_00805 [Deltaproteobacteria bacterium]|nr:hypothetical protein [Deltaproteobacteria bacterium]
MRAKRLMQGGFDLLLGYCELFQVMLLVLRSFTPLIHRVKRAFTLPFAFFAMSEVAFAQQSIGQAPGNDATYWTISGHVLATIIFLTWVAVGICMALLKLWTRDQGDLRKGKVGNLLNWIGLTDSSIEAVATKQMQTYKMANEERRRQFEQALIDYGYPVEGFARYKRIVKSLKIEQVDAISRYLEHLLAGELELAEQVRSEHRKAIALYEEHCCPEEDFAPNERIEIEIQLIPLHKLIQRLEVMPKGKNFNLAELPWQKEATAIKNYWYVYSNARSRAELALQGKLAYPDSRPFDDATDPGQNSYPGKVVCQNGEIIELGREEYERVAAMIQSHGVMPFDEFVRHQSFTDKYQQVADGHVHLHESLLSGAYEAIIFAVFEVRLYGASDPSRQGQQFTSREDRERYQVEMARSMFRPFLFETESGNFATDIPVHRLIAALAHLAALNTLVGEMQLTRKEMGLPPLHVWEMWFDLQRFAQLTLKYAIRLEAYSVHELEHLWQNMSQFAWWVQPLDVLSWYHGPLNWRNLASPQYMDLGLDPPEVDRVIPEPSRDQRPLRTFRVPPDWQAVATPEFWNDNGGEDGVNSTFQSRSGPDAQPPRPNKLISPRERLLMMARGRNG